MCQGPLGTSEPPHTGQVITFARGIKTAAFMLITILKTLPDKNKTRVLHSGTVPMALSGYLIHNRSVVSEYPVFVVKCVLMSKHEDTNTTPLVLWKQ